jgi:hypothetical protein
MQANVNQANVKGEERQKWMQMWDSVEEQFTSLPIWVQNMLFDDITTAIQNRIAVMSGTQKAASS